MQHAEIGEQLDYLVWMRDRVLTASAALTNVEFRSADTVTTRDLRATLAHQLECEWAWRVRLSEGAFPAGDVRPDDYPTLDVLAARWRDEERAFRRWFDRLTDADLAAAPPGEDNPLAMWRYLVYLVNHGTVQFAEAALLLTRLGHSPGELGFLAFCSRADGQHSA